MKFTYYLTQAVLEHDGRAIVQRDRVDVGAAGGEIRSRNVENPLLAVPTKRGVGIVGVDDVLDRGRNCS